MVNPVATTPLTYNGYVTQVGLMAIVGTSTVGGVVVGTDAFFNTLIPQMLDYAELRIQRDTNLLPAQQTNTSYSLSVGNNLLALSVNDFVSVRTINVNVNGQMTALLPTSVEWLQTVYPSTSTPGAPAYFAPLGGDATTGNTSNIFQLGPVPDNNYAASIVGTVRLPSLNKFNTNPQAGTATTFISTWLPDLLVIASMVYITQYQRNFSATSDQPDMGVNYETQYKSLLNGVVIEEARKQFSASGWSSLPPPTVASPGR